MEILFSSERIDFIRPIEDLAEEYMNLFNNPDVYQFITDNENNFSIEDEIKWVRNHQEDYIFTFINRSNGDFIGNGGFNSINEFSAEIAIVICPNYQNNHYGTEAMKAMIAYGFDVIGLEEITLVVYSNNSRAIHCYKTLGFEEYKQVLNVKFNNEEAINDIYMILRR